MSPSRSTAALALAVAVLAVALSGGAAGQVVLGEPDLETYLPENEVAPGTETELAVQVQNDAYVGTGSATEAVTTARAVSVEITDAGPFEVRTGETPVGQIADGSVTTADFDVVVPESVSPGTYEVDVRVRYSVTNRQDSSGDQRLSRRTTEELEVVVTDEPIFAVGNVTTALQPGTTDDAEIELRNVGSKTAHGSTVAFESGGGVTVDGGSSGTFLGDFAPGETRTITVDTSAEESIAGGAKPLEATVEYENGAGIEQEPKTATGSLETLAAQSFDVVELEDTLSVGYSGRITGAVRNDGPRPIADGVLVIEPMSDSLSIEERRIALPELGAGETADFGYATDVSGQSDPGARQVRFTLEYRNGGRTTTTVGPVSERVVVDDRRDEFTVTGSEANVTAGGSTTLTLTITNERPETLANIDARIYADSPLSSSSDEAFVDELGPGESDEITFGLAAEGGAMPKTYPVELDFQYDTERGDTVLSDTYQHPVAVGAPVDDGGGGPPVLAIVALLALIVGAGVWWRRRG